MSFLKRSKGSVAGMVAGMVAGLVMGMMVGLGGCERKQAAFAPPPPPVVTVAEPTRQVVPQVLDLTGTMRGVENVEVRARVRGFVETKHVQGGQRIKAGELIYTIDARPYEALVAQSEADLAAADADLRLAQTVLKRTSETVARGGGAEVELERATAERDQRLARVQLAKAKLDAAKLDVEFTRVTAPIDGRLSILTIEPGQLVGANDATLLGTIVNDTVMYVTFYVPERQLLDIRRAKQNKRPGEDGRPNDIRVLISLANETEYRHEGKYAWGDNIIDPKTGQMKIEAVFDNKDGVIIPGSFVRVRAIIGEQERMMVPDVAVQRDQNGAFVYVVGREGKVERRNVKTGLAVNRERALEPNEDGSMPLEARELVIVNGIQRARPGVVVTVQKAGGKMEGKSEGKPEGNADAGKAEPSGK